MKQFCFAPDRGIPRFLSEGDLRQCLVSLAATDVIFKESVLPNLLAWIDRSSVGQGFSTAGGGGITLVRMYDL
jgi:hypothetical protein